MISILFFSISVKSIRIRTTIIIVNDIDKNENRQNKGNSDANNSIYVWNEWTGNQIRIERNFKKEWEKKMINLWILRKNQAR